MQEDKPFRELTDAEFDALTARDKIEYLRRWVEAKNGIDELLAERMTRFGTLWPKRRVEDESDEK
jgi:hypothetical protein